MLVMSNFIVIGFSPVMITFANSPFRRRQTHVLILFPICVFFSCVWIPSSSAEVDRYIHQLQSKPRPRLKTSTRPAPSPKKVQLS